MALSSKAYAALGADVSESVRKLSAALAEPLEALATSDPTADARELESIGVKFKAWTDDVASAIDDLTDAPTEFDGPSNDVSRASRDVDALVLSALLVALIVILVPLTSSFMAVASVHLLREVVALLRLVDSVTTLDSAIAGLLTVLTLKGAARLGR